MMIENYIFDFDGTLMDTAPVIIATTRATISEMGLPERSEAEIRATIGLRLDEIPKALFPGLDVDGAQYAAYYRRLFPQFNSPGMAKPYPGVLAALRKLHERGCGLAIASSRSHSSLQEFVDDMGLSDLFVMLVGGEDVANGKPNPEPVLTILDAMGWEPRETLVVGDAAVDVLMGNSAGCKTCAVTYGNGTVAELASANPDAMIDDFARITELEF